MPELASTGGGMSRDDVSFGKSCHREVVLNLAIAFGGRTLRGQATQGVCLTALLLDGFGAAVVREVLFENHDSIFGFFVIRHRNVQVTIQAEIQVVKFNLHVRQISSTKRRTMSRQILFPRFFHFARHRQPLLLILQAIIDHKDKKPANASGFNNSSFSFGYE